MPNEISDSDKEKIFTTAALSNEIWPEVQQRVGEYQRASIVYGLISLGYCGVGAMYCSLGDIRMALSCFLFAMGAAGCTLGDDYISRAKSTLVWYTKEIHTSLNTAN